MTELIDWVYQLSVYVLFTLIRFIVKDHLSKNNCNCDDTIGTKGVLYKEKTICVKAKPWVYVVVLISRLPQVHNL